MLQISAELLAMSSDAALLIKNGKIIFANKAACDLLGSTCVGSSAKKYLGESISQIQSSSFIGEFPLNGRNYVIRMCSSDGLKALFLAPSNSHNSLINDAFVFSLRNCLMGIDLAMNMLREKADLHPELRSGLASISHECFKINRTISNISIIKGIHSKDLFFAPRTIDLSDFITKLVDGLSLIESGPELVLRAPKGISIEADPALIECIFFNLVSNCLIHAKGCRRIIIRLSEGKDQVYLTVDDDGCGIPPESLHSVFDRYRHGYEVKDLSRGPGLGFAAARAVARLHGGTILLESQPDSGTAVRVSLSRRLPIKFNVDQGITSYELSINNFLTGLAGFLPSKLYSDKYLE